MTTPAALRELPPLTTRNGRIVDSEGREVLLRGANLNALGEYWQGIPELPAVYPLTDEDWDRMTEYGFSAVRVLVNWSLIEPERGRYDEGYLDRVEAAVDAASLRGMYTVIDMHQDVFSAAIFTADPSECAPGTVPARGWDGAPAWAVFTDDQPTGLEDEANRATTRAAERAWVNFYTNRDGIRDAFTEMWGVVARRFAGRPEVAGYDLINEAENAMDEGQLGPLYDELIRGCVRAIRAADEASGVTHLIIIEPALPCQVRERGFVHPTTAAYDDDPTGIVYSPHNYAESLPDSTGSRWTTEEYNAWAADIAAAQGLPVWLGEYGVFGTDESSIDIAHRYARDEDARAWGGTWWVWRQSYGDPHRLRWSDDGWVLHPPTSNVRLHTADAATNVDQPTRELLSILGRGFPRATPGRIRLLESDPATRELLLVGDEARVPADLVLWTPTTTETHMVRTDGLEDVREYVVHGGRWITARVVTPGPYEVRVAARDAAVEKGAR